MAEKKKRKQDLILNKLEEYDKRFDTIDRRFGEHDKRFDIIDRKFGEYDKRFDTIDRRFNEVTNTLDKIVGELEKAREDRVFAKAKDDELGRKIEHVEQRLDKVELKVG
jgi:septation ring formation regulator EzrA